ncbi:hypothetical protein ACKI2N_029260 [Cupriavidus sp. 30B13]|uniref:hypothetical protein n=1 Tax=Cupriavidus sp. 30B13 TaxID=3384241 RepID=UPI003B8EEAA5
MKQVEKIIETESLAASNQVRHVDRWLSEVSAGKSTMDYDTWLECHLSEIVPFGQAVWYRQGRVTFRLEHGAVYEVSSPAKGVRRFRCLLDGTLPLIAFVGTRHHSPWLTIPNLFTLAELKSLNRIG